MLKEEKSSLVTVVVHTFNHENYIEDCLQGIVYQDAFDFIKILIIDDASTDSTLSKCQSFFERFPAKIEIVALPLNQLSQGFFVGYENLRSINTRYVAWCDGDDYWIDPRKISEQIAILDNNPNIGVVHTDYYMARYKSDGLKIEARTTIEIDKSKRLGTSRGLINGNHIKHSTSMIVRDAIDFDFVAAARGIYAGDWLICISATQNKEVHFMEQKTTVARITNGGIWNGSSDERNADQKQRVRWHCAANLPDSELRELFRKKVFFEWLRNKVALTRTYKTIRPIVVNCRKFKGRLRF